MRVSFEIWCPVAAYIGIFQIMHAITDMISFVSKRFVEGIFSLSFLPASQRCVLLNVEK
jgi:hypothetical protein